MTDIKTVDLYLFNKTTSIQTEHPDVVVALSKELEIMINDMLRKYPSAKLESIFTLSMLVLMDENKKLKNEIEKLIDERKIIENIVAEISDFSIIP